MPKKEYTTRDVLKFHLQGVAQAAGKALHGPEGDHTRGSILLRRISNPGDRGKGIVVAIGSKSWQTRIQLFNPTKQVWPTARRKFVYYPKQEHFESFAAGAAHTIEDTPGRTYPGAVGYLEGVIHDKLARVEIVQGCFHQKPAKTELSRSRADLYGGWRLQLLNQFFSEIVERKVPRVTFKLPGVKSGPNRTKSDAETFLRVTKKLGFVEVPNPRRGEIIVEHPDFKTTP
jgi:hypothetical protein